MYEITFQFENGAQEVKFSAAPGSTILEAAKSANVAIDAPCNGNGSCGKCRVKLVSGEVTGVQTGHISDEDYAAGWRLSCSTKPAGDITVLVPDIASAYQSRMKTADLSSGEEIAIFNQLQQDVQAAGVDFANDFVQAVLTLDEPTLDDTMPDTERLARFAQDAFDGCTEVRLTYHTVKKLAKTLREANFRVQITGTLTDGVLTIMDVSEKEDAPLYGCAIDIGTTTVTGVLMDLKTGTLTAKASAGNGQIRYGADVINRIVEQGKPGGVKRLQDAILKETLLPLVAAMCKSAGIPVSRVFRVCIASNTTMNHLLLGVDANPVRMEPYIPTFFQWRGMTAKDLGFPANPDAEILLAPNIGSYVGGDITAGAFTSLIWDKDEFSLFIDLGTNGELVFGNRDFMMSCACSAGPAFEGGDISCGMRATDGAVESVKIDKDTMEPTLGIVGPEGQRPVGICGSGIIDVIALPHLYYFLERPVCPRGQTRRARRARHGPVYPRDSRRIGDGPRNFHHGSGYRLVHPRKGRHFLGHQYHAFQSRHGRERFVSCVCRGRHRLRHQHGKRRAHRYAAGYRPGAVRVSGQHVALRRLRHGAVGLRSRQGRRAGVQHDLYGAFHESQIYG